MVNDNSNPRVFLDVSHGADPIGRLVIELFAQQAPKTVENFRQLCTGEHNGLSYAKAPFHRVIDEFMVQGGDIKEGDGTGTVSIYGGEFEDENLDWREMDAAGLVCSANRGKDTNGSQFFIGLVPNPHLNGKHTVFGRLVAGNDVLERIAKVPVDDNDTPLEPVLISKCGELERKKKSKPEQAPKLVADTEVHGDDRGRRRKSDQDHSSEEENATRSHETKRKRRQSDNIVDEGIRGRPRLRSNSRASSQPFSDEDDVVRREHSSSREQKRKRSPSPSRPVDRRADDSGDYRRRRSLPNQYREQDRGYDRYRPSPRRDNRGYGYTGANRNNRRQRHDREGRLDNDDGGRLGGGNYDDDAPAVQFKGRGVMKYREDKRW